MLEQVKQFVDESFKLKKPHFQRTIYWLLQLKPDADEPMKIAAYAHDIERAFNPISMDFFKTHELNNSTYLTKHQKGGAKLMSKFLRKYHYSEKDIQRVAEMIKFHEVGGTFESDLIKDADSISYFENNAPNHIEKFGRILGKEKTRVKYDFMFNRITSFKAKDIARPMYKKAINLLNKI